jgi:regulator of protease activity HflC (stomatin/prohibitin superfamily)
MIAGYSLNIWVKKTIRKKLEKKERFDEDAFKLMRLVGLIVGILCSIILPFFFFTIVPAGHVGVVDTFGDVSKNQLNPGLNLVNPYSNIYTFSIKTEEFKEELKLPTKEGLTMKMEVSVLYHVIPGEMPNIYSTLGTDFEEKFIVSNARSLIRGVTVKYDAKDLYTANREKVENDMKDDMTKVTSPRGIFVEAVLIRDISLPTDLENAITRKLKSDQEAQEMEFKINKEKKEADRKRIEAQGIKDFQTIVSEGISDKLLQWKGIEATIELSKSPNSKVVIIGGGKDGLPMILNSER